MAAFIILLFVVAHRFLRLDLVNDVAARIPIRSILLVLLAAALAQGLLFRSVRLRLGMHLLIQGLLWVWAGVTKIVAEGTTMLVPFLKDDYTKDVIFAVLVGTLCDSVRKLRLLAFTFIGVMTVIALVVIPQHSGEKKCYHFTFGANVLNYEQQTDNRPCMAAPDCFDLPKGEEHLRNENWACEREGIWGLATVVDRVHYVGNLMDPNSLSLALVMAAALALGFLTWPTDGRLGRPLPFFARILLWGTLGIMAVALYYAGSRAGQMALALVLMLSFYSRIGIAGVTLLGIAGLPVVFFLTRHSRNVAEAAYSTYTRIQTQLNGYQAFLDNPLFGVGYGNYGKISFINAHNSMMLTAAETGVMGGALFLLGVYVAFKFLWQVSQMPLDASRPADPMEEVDRYVDADGEVVTEGTLIDLRHQARVLLVMLIGVFFCVAFLSLAFDVMWLFPVGLVAAFYGVMREEIPDYHVNLSLLEILGALAVGGMLPAVTAAILA